MIEIWIKHLDPRTGDRCSRAAKPNTFDDADDAKKEVTRRNKETPFHHVLVLVGHEHKGSWLDEYFGDIDGAFDAIWREDDQEE